MRVLLVAVLLCASAEAGTASAEAGYSHKKRHKSSSGSSAGDMLVSLAELLHIRTPPFVYNSDSVGSRQEMIDALSVGRRLGGERRRPLLGGKSRSATSAGEAGVG